jgi:hypothetical protein
MVTIHNLQMKVECCSGRGSTELPWGFTSSKPHCTSCHSRTLLRNLLPPCQSLAQVSPWSYCTESPKFPPLSHNCIQTEGSVYRGTARGKGGVRPPRAAKLIFRIKKLIFRLTNFKFLSRTTMNFDKQL